jgi:hypothetical protein
VQDFSAESLAKPAKHNPTEVHIENSESCSGGRRAFESESTALSKQSTRTILTSPWQSQRLWRGVAFRDELTESRGRNEDKR